MEDNLNPGYRPKTKSKHYYDDEIIGIYYENSKIIIHLKEGVRRLQFNPLEEYVEEFYTDFKIKMNNFIETRDKIKSEERDYN